MGARHTTGSSSGDRKVLKTEWREMGRRKARWRWGDGTNERDQQGCSEAGYPFDIGVNARLRKAKTNDVRAHLNRQCRA